MKKQSPYLESWLLSFAILVFFNTEVAASREVNIFIWDKKEIQCIWMKNTSIPLSIAFIKEEGVISDIYNLYPFSTLSVCSTDKVKYALEVNRGWFKENEITRGDTVISSQIK